MKRISLATIGVLLLLAGAVEADLIVDDGPRRAPSRVGPTRLTADLGPYASSGYWRLEIEPGATLYGIARTKLGDGKRWEEIADLNPVDPEALPVGKKLWMPPKSPPKTGVTPPRYDFYWWSPAEVVPTTPLVPGESFQSEPEGGHQILAVEHEHLQAFRAAVRASEGKRDRMDALIAKPWVAASVGVGGRQEVSTGAPVVAFTQHVAVTAIEDGVVRVKTSPIDAVMAPPVPAGVAPPPPPPSAVSEPVPLPEVPPADGPPPGVLPPADPFAEEPPPADATSPSDATEATAGSGANAVVVAGVILAIVAAAFFALRTMRRRDGEEGIA
jgi:hypothetical protein